MTTILGGDIAVPKLYRPGLGYSPASGPQNGGLGVNANPYVYSSTFFGDNVKALFPSVVADAVAAGKVSFGRRRSRKRSKRSKKRSRKSSKKSRKRSRRKSRKSKKSRKRSRKRKRSKSRKSEMDSKVERQRLREKQLFEKLQKLDEKVGGDGMEIERALQDMIDIAEDILADADE